MNNTKSLLIAINTVFSQEELRAYIKNLVRGQYNLDNLSSCDVFKHWIKTTPWVNDGVLEDGEVSKVFSKQKLFLSFDVLDRVINMGNIPLLVTELNTGTVLKVLAKDICPHNLPLYNFVWTIDAEAVYCAFKDVVEASITNNKKQS